MTSLVTSTKPTGRGVATLRHDEPLEESGWGAEGGEGYGVLVDGDSVERRHEVEQREDAPLAQGFQDFVDTGDVKLTERADGVELLVVYHYSDVAVFLGDGDHGAGVRRCRVLGEAGGQVLVEYHIFLLAEDGINAARTGSDRDSVRGDGDLERNKRARAKISLGLEETSVNPQRTSPKAVITDGVHPEPRRSNAMSRRWRGNWSHRQRKLVRCWPLRRFSSLGQGALGVGEELVGGSPSSATGMLSCRAWTSVMSGVGKDSLERSRRADSGICVSGEEEFPREVA